MARKNKIDFFQPGGKLFMNGDKPDQDTFQDLVDSTTFPKEVNDRGKTSEAGLWKTTTDAKVNTRDHLDVAGISPIGFPTALKPSQLFNIVPADGQVIITPVARTVASPGFTDAPDVLDIEIGINPNYPALNTDTDNVSWEGEFVGPLVATVKKAEVWVATSPGCGVQVANTPLATGVDLSTTLINWINAQNETVDTIEDIGASLCGLLSVVNDIVLPRVTTTTYTFLASDMLNGAKLSNNTDNPDGNEHTPHLRLKDGTVTFHGVILVPTTITDDTDVLKIPREFITSLTSSIPTPTGMDRQFIVEYGALPARVGVKMGNIGGGASPNDWGALNFADCRVASAVGVAFTDVLNGYRRLSLNGITFTFFI